MSKVIRMMSLKAGVIENGTTVGENGVRSDFNNRQWKIKDEDGKEIIRQKPFTKQYNTTIDDSLYMRKLEALQKEIMGSDLVEETKDGVQYIKTLLSMSFDEPYKKKDE